jgi:protein ImuB
MMAGRSDPRRVLVVWCPGWTQGEGQPDRADSLAREFELVIAAVKELCPRVEVLRPGTCAIPARGPARYFGGEQELAGRITEAVTGRGVECQVGIADGLFAAQLAARAPGGIIVPPGRTPAFLAAQPVEVLGDPDLAGLLERLGISTLGEFAALPAADVPNRFGAAGELAHRLARGLDPRPLAPRPPATDLSVSQEFDPPVDSAEPVIFAAKALAQALRAGLASHGLACIRVQIQLTCSDGREITRLWRHDGLLSAIAVAERVRWQLDAWRGWGPALQQARRGWGPALQEVWRPAQAAQPEDPPGIALLRLIPDQLVRDEGHQLGLWGEAVIPDRLARAAVRVQAILGHGAVTCPVLGGGRDPAERVTLIPFGDAARPRFPCGRPWPGRIPPPDPATVYPAPLPAAVTDTAGVPVVVTGRALVSGQPSRLSVAGRPELKITAWAGPWPVTERWWRRPGTRGHRKAYFQLVTGDDSGWLAVVCKGRWLIAAGYDLTAARQAAPAGTTGEQDRGLGQPSRAMAGVRAVAVLGPFPPRRRTEAARRPAGRRPAARSRRL